MSTDKGYYIEHKFGRWLVDGKRLQDMNQDERDFMDDYFREYKATLELWKTYPPAN